MDYRTKLNKQLAEQARKRRAMFYRQHINKGISCADLAKKHGVSRQRMSLMLLLARSEYEI